VLFKERQRLDAKADRAAEAKKPAAPEAVILDWQLLTLQASQVFVPPITTEQLTSAVSAWSRSRIAADYVPKLRDSSDALLYALGGNSYLIQLPHGTASSAARFAYAHELGHILLFQYLEDGIWEGTARGEENAYACGADGLIERACNIIAEEFLAPLPEYEWEFGKHERGVDCILDLARMFDISVQCSAIRATRVVRKDAALGIWREGADSSAQVWRSRRLEECMEADALFKDGVESLVAESKKTSEVVRRNLRAGGPEGRDVVAEAKTVNPGRPGNYVIAFISLAPTGVARSQVKRGELF
jgi:Zn-dependent peptidase ImmA (M78 family)